MVRVAVITADFYTEIAQGLEDKAHAVLKQNKVEPVPLRVPGAFELPMALAIWRLRARLTRATWF